MTITKLFVYRLLLIFFVNKISYYPRRQRRRGRVDEVGPFHSFLHPTDTPIESVERHTTGPEKRIDLTSTIAELPTVSVWFEWRNSFSYLRWILTELVRSKE